MFRSIIFGSQLQNCLARGYERCSEASSLLLSCRTVLQEGMKDVLKHYLWYSAAELSCKRVRKMFRSIIFGTQLQNCLARGYERCSEASSLVLSCRTVLEEGMKDVPKHHLCYSAAELSWKRVRKMFRSIIFGSQLQNCLGRGYERCSEASSLVLSCRTVLEEGMKDVPKHHLWYSATELSCKRVRKMLRSIIFAISATRL